MSLSRSPPPTVLFQGRSLEAVQKRGKKNSCARAFHCDRARDRPRAPLTTRLTARGPRETLKCAITCGPRAQPRDHRWRRRRRPTAAERARELARSQWKLLAANFSIPRENAEAFTLRHERMSHSVLRVRYAFKTLRKIYS